MSGTPVSGNRFYVCDAWNPVIDYMSGTPGLTVIVHHLYPDHCFANLVYLICVKVL